MNRRTYWVRGEDETYALKEAYRDGVNCFTTREAAEVVETDDSLFEVIVVRHDDEQRWTVREGVNGLERLMSNGDWQRFSYHPIYPYDDIEVRGVQIEGAVVHGKNTFLNNRKATQ